MPAKKNPIKAAGEAVKAEAAKVEKKTRTAAKKVADKATAAEIEAKKTTKKFSRTVKTKAEETNAAAAKTARKAKAAKLDIIIQSPMGGNISAEEIAAKIPDGAESVFVRVDHNKLYWIRGEETGSVDIW